MWNLKQFEEIYARYQSSGLQVKEFCRNEYIKEAKFFYWQRRLRKQKSLSGQPSGFVPIVFTGGVPQPQRDVLPHRAVMTGSISTNDIYEIIYPGGVVLRVPSGTDLGQLQSLIFLTRQGHV